VDSTPQTPRALLRWLLYAGLWLLLSSVFASQLFLAGYVTPWPRAFAAEAMYWLSWWILAPAVFWWCRRCSAFAWPLRAPALLVGALLAVFAQPLIGQTLVLTLSWMQICGGACEQATVPFTPAWFMQAVRVAGVNLPVYAGVVLGWHAISFYREARDRQVKAMELESSLHQAQLQALRSQLNPHFLFNALHSMAELVHSNPRLAEQLIVRLGELLRQVLQSSAAQEVPLASELEFIRGYVEIEQMRLGDRLSVEWNVDPQLLRALVPSLLLQPLVENAIQHGIAASAGAGTLGIEVRRDGDSLCLEVRDSGPGVRPETAPRAPGIGLTNTRIRLEHLYGARHSFELHTGHGTQVRARIPLAFA
jgi:hypothetical protein